ncbi:MAG: hypothetical protein ACXABO_21345 [Promethearchaeota archaeon]
MTGIFPASIPADIVSQLTASYVRYDDLSSSSKSKQSTSETLTYVDWDHDHMVQMREYKDSLEDRFSFLNLESGLETYDITNYETGETTEVHAPLFIMSPEEFTSQETWGVDNVPIKFDALTILQEGIFTYENLYEKSIIINIPNRYNLFHDYLRTDLSAVSTEGTAFRVEGAFITPPDETVYYTSDMDAFKASQNMPIERFTWQDHTIDINPAKIRGHYLFYDSDYDGFMETVFILSPDDDSNGVYDVVSIGYNYDGDYNFIPYERVGSSRESRTFTTFGQSYEFIPNRNQHNPIPRGDTQIWYEDFYPYFVDLLYPTDITGEYISKDPIFGIWRLMPTGESNNPLLFHQAKSKEYAEAWSIYEGQLWQEIWDQVNMIVIVGTVSADVAATGLGAPFAALTFAATYFLLSQANNEEEKREMRQQMKARTYYPVDSVRNAPVVVSDKRRSDYADIMEHWQGYPSAKYATVTGGEPGNLFIGEAVVVLPEELRGEGLSLDYFFMTNEILGYNNRDGYMVTAVEGYGDIFDYETNRNYLAFQYRTNTLGYLENNVEELSNGQFNRIKPLSINGRPAYVFVDKQSILPPRSYLGPIVVNPDRYRQIGSREHIISVDVDNIGFSADIPLNDHFRLKHTHKPSFTLNKCLFCIFVTSNIQLASPYSY